MSERVVPNLYRSKYHIIGVITYVVKRHASTSHVISYNYVCTTIGSYDYDNTELTLTVFCYPAFTDGNICQLLSNMYLFPALYVPVILVLI